MTVLDDSRAAYATLAHVIPRIDTARRKLQEQLPGHGPRHGAPPSHGQLLEHCECDPDDSSCAHNVALTGPERAMADAEAGRIDHARAELRELDQLAARLRPLVARIDEIVTTYARTTSAPKADPAQPPQERDGDGKLIWCQSCWQHRGHLNPTHADYTDLCFWCGRFAKRNDRWPTIDELELHHQGKRVRVKDPVTIRPARRRKPTQKELRAERMQSVLDRRRKRLAGSQDPVTGA